MRTDHLPTEPARALARSLRAKETDAECKLWAELRGRRLAGLRFRRQHPISSYVVDFYCAEACLIIEIDGASHGAPDMHTRDTARRDFFASFGLRMLRFSNESVLHRMAWVRAMIRKAAGEQSESRVS